MLNLEVAEEVKKSIEQENASLAQSVKDKAREAQTIEAFLTLIEELASGKKHGTDEDVDYFDVRLSVPKTKTTTTQKDTT